MILDMRVKTFLEVIKCGSFTQAAKKEYRSTVAIMNQITSLENELGVKLLNRTNQGVTPTTAGEEFYQGAVKLDVQAKQLIDTTRQVSQTTMKTVRIGTSLLRPSDVLIKKWARASSENNRFILQLIPFVDKFSSQSNQLLTPDMDCVVTPNSVKKWSELYNYLPLGQSKCMIGIAKGNPLFKKDSLTWSDLAGQQIFLLQKGLSTVVDEIRETLTKKVSQIKIRNLSHLYDLKSFDQVIANKGLVEMPALWEGIHPEIKLVTMDWNYTIPYGLIYRKHPSPKMKEFIKDLKQIIK